MLNKNILLVINTSKLGIVENSNHSLLRQSNLKN